MGWRAVFKIEALIWVSFWRFSNFMRSVGRVDSNSRSQSKNIGMKLVLNLRMNDMVHVLSTMWRIKNQPSNSTSFSGNALCLLILVVGRLYWGLQVTSSFSIWGCISKGCFERGIIWRAIKPEGFDLEYCSSLQARACKMTSKYGIW